MLDLRPRLIMFDLDGTLAHTLPQLALAAGATARELGYPVPPRSEVATYIGNGVPMLLTRTLTHNLEARLEDISPELLKRALAVFQERYLAGLNRDFHLFDGVLDGLKLFKSMGIKLAVVTNKSKIFVGPLLGYMGVAPFIDLYLGGDSLPVKKPDPAPLWYCCDHFGVERSRALMVGDSRYDILAAKNAAVSVTAFSYGYNGGMDLSTFEPDYLFDSFSELTKLITALPEA